MGKEKKVKVASIEDIVSFLQKNGAGSVIRRSDVGKISCGMLNPGTMANADSAGTGVDERITFGALKRVSYPIESLARYMVGKGFVIEKSAAV